MPDAFFFCIHSSCALCGGLSLLLFSNSLMFKHKFKFLPGGGFSPLTPCA